VKTRLIKASQQLKQGIQETLVCS